VRTPQNPHERVQMFPKIIKVAVPSVQHSPMFGHEPEVQIVCKSYLSTKHRNLVYFLSTVCLTRHQCCFVFVFLLVLVRYTVLLSVSLTRIYFGFVWFFILVLVASTVVSIDLIYSVLYESLNFNLLTNLIIVIRIAPLLEGNIIVSYIKLLLSDDYRVNR